jgi:hypothetical protein
LKVVLIRISERFRYFTLLSQSGLAQILLRLGSTIPQFYSAAAVDDCRLSGNSVSAISQSYLDGLEAKKAKKKAEAQEKLNF